MNLEGFTSHLQHVAHNKGVNTYFEKVYSLQRLIEILKKYCKKESEFRLNLKNYRT